ncbi:MAG: FecR family protein, partial [Pseudomonadota bacterium]
MNPEFPLKNAILLMALAAAYPLTDTAATPAGVAQFAVGEVNVRRVDGQAEALVKGKDIESGQAIVTGATGRAQVRFSDGGLVSLQPNTEFKVSNYVDKADPKEDRFLVDLLRGSMRAITGLIGKRNRDNYKVMTSTATIGIRGSGFNASYNPDGTLAVTTELDAIEVCNAAGCVGLTAGESVLVLSNQALPVRTNTRADVPTPQTKQDPVVAGNQVSESGETVAIVTPAPAPSPAPAPAPTPSPPPPSPPPPPPPPPPSAPKLLTGIAFTSLGVTEDGFDQRVSVNGSLLLGDTQKPTQPTAYTSASSSVGTGSLLGNGSATTSSGSLENGDYLVIGTWDGASWTRPGTSPVTVGFTAFAAGVASPSTALAALNGVRASYSLQSATPVYAQFGGPGVLQPTSKITADFTNAFVNVNLDVQMPADISYKLQGGFSALGDGVFRGSLAVSGSACQGVNAGCGTGLVSGGFSGRNVQNAFLSYGGFSLANGAFGGAASFASSGQIPTPSSDTQTDLAILVTEGGGVLRNHLFETSDATVVTPTFKGERLDSFIERVNSSNTTQLRSSSTSSFGSLGVNTDADFIGWGNWIAGSKEVKTQQSTVLYGLDSVHY